MEEEKRKGPAIIIGIVVGLLMVIIHVLADGINYWDSSRDFLFWLARIPLYFLIGMTAANSQFKHDIFSDAPLDNLGNAARSASLILCIFDWIYVILRSLITDDSGLFSGLGIVMSIILVAFDFLIAIVLGNAAGSLVRRKNDLNSIDN